MDTPPIFLRRKKLQKYETYYLSSPDIVTFKESRPLQLPVDGQSEAEQLSAKTALKTESFHSWLILVAVFCYNVIMGSHFMALGIYYVKFTEAFQTTKATAGFVASFHWSVASFGSVFASVFIEVFGIRPVAVFGGLMFAVGVFTSAFTPSIYVLYLTYGCLAGLGISFTRMASMIIIQEHFNKHRNMATTLSVSGLPCGNIISPLITNYLLETFAWRGALIIHSGLVLHVLALALVFSPPHSAKQTTTINAGDDGRKAKTAKATDAEDTSTDANPDGKIVIVKSCLKSFDFSMLREAIIWPFLISAMLSRTLITSFYEHTPSRAVFLGNDLKYSGYLISVLSMGNLTSRIACSVWMGLRKVNPIVLMAFGAGLQGFVTIVLTFFSSYASLVVFTGLFGCGQGILYPTIILSTVKLVGVENFSKTTAVLSIFTCIGEFIATPLTGLMFDVTQDYNVPFYMNGVFGLLASVAALVVFVMHRYRRQHQASKPCTALPADDIKNKQLGAIMERERTYTF